MTSTNPSALSPLESALLQRPHTHRLHTATAGRKFGSFRVMAHLMETVQYLVHVFRLCCFGHLTGGSVCSVSIIRGRCNRDHGMFPSKGTSCSVERDCTLPSTNTRRNAIVAAASDRAREH
jgi:hypothetical protein